VRHWSESIIIPPADSNNIGRDEVVKKEARGINSSIVN
jgi:hypothetical protein